MPTDWLETVIMLTLVDCSRFATTRASRWVTSYPSAGSEAQRARTACPSNSKASTGLAATAPKAHLYGGNSQDQPTIFIGEVPGRAGITLGRRDELVRAGGQAR